MGLTRTEQETVIRWDEDAKTVFIWSASPVTWRKMARLGLRPQRETSTHGHPSGRFYSLPLAGFRWGLKARRAPGSAPSGFARRHPVNNGAPRGQEPSGEPGGGA